jgi:hypothetical protein
VETGRERGRETEVANAERLLDVLTFLAAHPERHDQNFWLKKRDCGTVACLAGWAVLRNGYVEHYAPEIPDFFRGVYRSDDPHQELRHVSYVAEEVLGLTPDEGARLFDEQNTLTDLWRLADEFTDGEVSRLLDAGSVTA